MTKVEVGDIVCTDIARIVYASVRDARRAREATRTGHSINLIMPGTLMLVLADEEHDMVHVCTDKLTGFVYVSLLSVVAPHHKERP